MSLAFDLAHDRVVARTDALASALTVLSVVLVFAISTPTLVYWGISYEDAGGSVLHKVHPGTWCVLAAVGLRALGSGNPVGFALADIARFPGVAVFLATCALLGFEMIAVQHVPFTFLIDTFIVPALTLVLLADLGARGRASIELFLHVFMTCNAALGVFESLSDYRLVPALYDGQEIGLELEWRATAILGHPLSNAFITGCYILAIGYGGGRLLPSLARLPMIVLQLFAMAAFGGRASLVSVLALLAIVAARGLARIAMGARVDPRAIGLALLLAPLAAGAAFSIWDSGYLDRLIDRFSDDRGSARARLAMFEVLAHVSWDDLIVGPDAEYVASLRALEGTEAGIESFWIGFLLANGIVLCGIFFTGLGAFCGALVRRCSVGIWPLLVLLLIVITTSVSISTKTTMLTCFVALAQILLPRRAARP